MHTKEHYILTINPGSTSTKLALYRDLELVDQVTIRHSLEEFKSCENVYDQREIRTRYLYDFLHAQGIERGGLSAVVGRGGMLRPIDSGTYAVNEKMIEDLTGTQAGLHASCLGGLMAADVGREYDAPAYIVDPVVVDEMEPVAKISGIPGIERKSVFHALNTKAITKGCAEELGMPYEDGRFVVAHMGGGITVGAHHYGRVIDVCDGINGEGPFTPERSGTVPLRPVIEMCFSGRYTKDEMLELVSKHGGMVAYLGTNDLMKVEKMIRGGDEFAALIVDSMAYQVSKEIGAMAAALEGRVDAIILTGGLAFSKRFTGAIKQRVDQIARVLTRPGEDEMYALARGALLVLTGRETVMVYQ